jgi:N-methylhydantoinase B
MRAHISDLPGGTYVFENFMDSDAVVNEPLRIHVEMTIQGSDVHLDFSKSPPPCKGSMNAIISTTKSACYLAFKQVFPDIPVNAGCFAPSVVPYLSIRI